MAKEILEVDLQEKDALRVMDSVSKRASLGLKRRENGQFDHAERHVESQSYALTADGIDTQTFVRLYVDGTWSASANLALGD